MGEMAGEVIGAELVGWVETLLQQVIRPGGQHFPMLGRIVGVALHHGDRRGQHQHVATLLHRHITIVGLAVRDRIGAHVMCWEGLLPQTALREAEDWVHHALQQLRVVAQEKRG